MNNLITISLLLGSYLAGVSGSSTCNVSGCWSCWPDPNTCALCDPFHWLYNGDCLDCSISTAWCQICPNEGRPCLRCDPGFFLTSNNLCDLCRYKNADCKYCSADGERCFICEDGSYATNGECVNNSPCPLGQFREPVTTLCADCAHSIAYCSKCSSDGFKCFECDSGFFREQSFDPNVKDSCKLCYTKFPNCSTCTDSYCVSCINGWHKNSYGECVA